MKITVKSRLNRYELYMEPGNELLGQIRKKRSSGGRLDILDAGNKLTASVRQEDETLFITDAGGGTVSCQLLYEEDEQGHRVGESLVRPSMPEQIRFDTEQGLLSVIQTPRRDFEVFLNGQKISKMVHMLGLTKEIRVVEDVIPAAYYSVIFALAFLMLHDDDIDII